MFPAHVVEVAIASPDGIGQFRTAIGHALNWWNSTSAARHQLMLMPSGEHNRCDVLISVFDPLRSTANEVMRGIVHAKAAGSLALGWLIAESPSHSLGSDDQARLDDLVARLGKVGISPRYLGHVDAHVERRLHDAITADLTPANLGPLLDRFESSASVGQVTIHRMPVALLGPHIFAVTVTNHRTSLVIDLKVRVDAVDSEGNQLPDGATRSRQLLADVFAKLRAGPSTEQELSRMDLLAAHTTLDFPRWLRPGHRASALYEVDVSASPRVRIEFEDHAGVVWSRTNDDEPRQISKRRPCCP
jgi:hypothetical protein